MNFDLKKSLAICLVLTNAAIATVAMAKDNKEPTIVNGTVSFVIDGDRFILQTEDNQHYVRMKWIDAPNDGQPLNDDARRFLIDLIQGREVTVISDNSDVNGCLYGEVVSEMQNYNIEMVNAGYANILEGAPSEYIKTSISAKNENRGIWHENSRVERGSAYLTPVEFSSSCNYEDLSIVDYKLEESLKEGRGGDRYFQILLAIIIGTIIGYFLCKALHYIDDPRVSVAAAKKREIDKMDEELDSEK
jgi:endonuclease YncB( thermonuclease family)